MATVKAVSLMLQETFAYWTLLSTTSGVQHVNVAALVGVRCTLGCFVYTLAVDLLLCPCCTRTERWALLLSAARSMGLMVAHGVRVSHGTTWFGAQALQKRDVGHRSERYVSTTTTSYPTSASLVPLMHRRSLSGHGCKSLHLILVSSRQLGWPSAALPLGAKAPKGPLVPEGARGLVLHYN